MGKSTRPSETRHTNGAFDIKTDTNIAMLESEIVNVSNSHDTPIDQNWDSTESKSNRSFAQNLIMSFKKQRRKTTIPSSKHYSTEAFTTFIKRYRDSYNVLV